MATFIKESYRSGITLGVANALYGNAQIIALFGGVTDARDVHSAVRTAALTHYGSYHPDDSKLPLRDIHVNPLAGDSALYVEATLSYSYDHTSKPTQEAYKLIDGGNGTIGLRYYSPATRLVDGRPQFYLITGDPRLNYSNGVYSASSYSYPVNYQIMRLRTVLDSDPTDVLKTRVGLSNSSTVKLHEITDPAGNPAAGETQREYQPFELWFRNYTTDANDTPSGIKYVVTYELWCLDSPGWVQEEIVYPYGPYLFEWARIPGWTGITQFPLVQTAIIPYAMAPRIGPMNNILPVHTM